MWRRGGVTEAALGWGMNKTLRQQLVEDIIAILQQARPLIAAIERKDRALGTQLRRSLSSIPLNVAEAFGASGGNTRLRFRTALGSLYESQAALQVAAAWRYVDQAQAAALVRELEIFGGRLYGLARM